MEKKGEKSLFAVFKKKDGVNETCVMRKLEQDERNFKNEFCYRRLNKYNEDNFDSILDFGDIEPGMEIEVNFEKKRLLDRTLPYSQIRGTKVGPSFKKWHKFLK